jgi:uncharacterized membrane protein YphA (DoxX/SURF4 family)
MPEPSQPTAQAPAPLWPLLPRLVMGGLFLFSAWQKLKPPPIIETQGTKLTLQSGPEAFVESIRSFKLLPELLIRPTAGAIPWTEALCGMALILGLWARAAGLLSSLLLIAFTVAVISVILREMNITCGCFGSFKLLCQGAVSWCKVGENSIMLALCALIAFQGPGRLSVDFARGRA